MSEMVEYVDFDDLAVEGGDDWMEGDLIEGTDDEYAEAFEGDWDEVPDEWVEGEEDEMGFLRMPRIRIPRIRLPFGRRRRRRPSRRRSSFPARIVRRRVPSPLASSPIPRGITRIKQSAPKPDGYSLLPLDTGATLVPAGNTATISAQCQQLFKPMNIIFDPTVAPDFVVTSIRCGNIEQLVGTGQIPASNFSAENAMNQLNLDVIPAALSLVIGVTNTAGAPRRLRGSSAGYKAR